jgi:hypothetical protein
MTTTADYRLDWTEALSRLRARSGVALARHARDCGMDDRTIHRLARGEIQDPRMRQGLRLLDRCAEHLSPDDWAAVRGEVRR